MVCSKCGNCCRYLAFTVNLPINQVKELIQQPLLFFTVNKIFNDDEKKYYSYHKVMLIEDKGKTILYLPNDTPEQTHIEYISRNNYRVIVYYPCNKLKNSLCSIWDDRPTVCHYDKSTLPLWKPKGCTD